MTWSETVRASGEVVTDSLTEGFHYYSLILDGLPVADPASETFYGDGPDGKQD